MNVEYRKKGIYKLNKYELSNFILCSDNKEFRVHIMRGGGGITCDITVRRSSKDEGSEVQMTHSQQHVAGLREVFKLYKRRIASGLHYNSMKYGSFEGDVIHPQRKRMRLYCNVKRKDGGFAPVPYELEIKQIYTQRV